MRREQTRPTANLDFSIGRKVPDVCVDYVLWVSLVAVHKALYEVRLDDDVVVRRDDGQVRIGVHRRSQLFQCTTVLLHPQQLEVRNLFGQCQYVLGNLGFLLRKLVRTQYENDLISIGGILLQQREQD